MTILISIWGSDKPGLIAAVAGRLFDLGFDLGDTSFAVLGTGFEFSTIAEAPPGIETSQVQCSLASLDHLSGCEIEVEEFRHRPVREGAGLATHSVTLRGGDQPGLLARLTEVLLDFGANVVRLNADRVAGRARNHNATDLDISVPPERAEACLSAMVNTAGQLQLSCQWRALSAPPE